MSTRLFVSLAIVVIAVSAVLGALFGSRFGGEPGPARATSPVVLAPGDVVALEDGTRLRFAGVIRDSRCPMDVVCIRAGEAVIGFELESPDGATERFTIELGTGGPAGIEVGGYAVEVQELQPYPKASEPTAPDDYRATVVVGTT